MSLRKEIRELYYAISADIEHGECFYDGDVLNGFFYNLDKMKELAYRYFKENQKEQEDNS